MQCSPFIKGEHEERKWPYRLVRQDDGTLVFRAARPDQRSQCSKCGKHIGKGRPQHEKFCNGTVQQYVWFLRNKAPVPATWEITARRADVTVEEAKALYAAEEARRAELEEIDD